MNNKLTDKELATDVLSCHKSLLNMYTVGIMESSTTAQQKLYLESFEACAKDQFKVFGYMQDKNFYPLEDAPDKKITEAKDMFDKLKQDMQ